MADLRTDDDSFDVRTGLIHWWLYRQDGTKQPMTINDSKHNRRFVSWCRVHDRHTPRGKTK